MPLRVPPLHLGHPMVRAERALSISLSDAPTLTYVVQLAAAESARARRASDLDHDGIVSTTEGNAHVDRWSAVLCREVRFALGRDKYGETHALSEAKLVSVESVGMVAATDDKTQVRVTWTFTLPLVSAEDRLRIDDALDIVPFDHTEVRVLDSPSRPLVGIGDDPSVLSISPRLAWVDSARPIGSRSIHIVWRPQPRPVVPYVPLVFAIAVAGSLGWLWWRRASRQRTIRR